MEQGKPQYLRAADIKAARKADESGDGKRKTISAHVLKVLIYLAFAEMRAGDYNREVNDIVISLKHYLDKGFLDD